ncbi:hypothetical protein [Brevundimonas lenta]|uniref:Uncharacterized protein n=1 Tax=Brevundimonas lenta TaxID=424796 RepID=A0A7W6NNX5_9CAUL|nr:hypothetical protein [Brevundimonas lenta]MBB4081602.1 hypothetical protein [Brevundimonas lenta]
MAIVGLSPIVVSSQDESIGRIVIYLLLPPFLSSAGPRLVMAALLLWGGCLLLRPASRRRLRTVAVCCAAVGVVSGIWEIASSELAFARAWSNTSDWTLADARAYFLSVNYLDALLQAAFGLFSCVLLLALGNLRRWPQA